MIAFSCAHCGLKLKVKDEFAGRQSSCPTCKQRLVVPAPDRTQPHVPADRIDGLLSSLSRAGIDAGVTLGVEDQDKSQDPRRSVRELLERHGKAGERYLLESEVARGGMGVVLRAVDCDIRREVAVKYLLDQTDLRRKARFVEEAQITGQLEHPNIVPIHELGIDAQKRLFFSMKMVKGRSLAQALDALRQNPRTAERDFSLGRLLTVLVNVCHALAYAHSRGVVHRDLKPANIMIGDFGEVYVMDWGLAKVLKSRDREGAEEPAPLPHGRGSPPNSKVVTNREGDADLTQDGAVLGTPAYMPPEQAMGKIAAIDPRSDVYSLGAILYEVLTLQPPVDKEGGYMSILMRVSQGEIVLPEVRAPQRAKAGKVPKELAAVAMKALAREPKDRYPNVEALRRDIERFLEGRSVSAKSDTAREMLWKMVRRNKAVSAASFVFLFLLLVAFGFTLKSYRDKEMRTRQAVPAFVRAARLGINEGQLDDAFEQVKVALDFDPKHAEAHLIKGQLLIVRRKYPEALAELEQYLKQKPGDQAAARLAELCRRSRDDDAARIAFADAFTEQSAIPLADGVMSQFGNNAPRFRQQMLVLYRKRIEKAWPGAGKALELSPEGNFVLNLFQARDRVTDLSPLRGMALSVLDLGHCGRLRDLSALKGMPLQRLSLLRCGEVRDLSPLEAMPLVSLDLTDCTQIKDLTPLPAATLRTLSLIHCSQLRDLSQLRGLKLTSLQLWGNPEIADLSPLKGMPLTVLRLPNCAKVRDLSPLKGMRLTDLNINSCPLTTDLSVLRGMPLTRLHLGGCDRRRDLALIREFPLTFLGIGSSGVADLTPLKELKLTQLDMNGCPVQDLSPLKGMKLGWLSLDGCKNVTDLSPLRGMKLSYLAMGGTAVTDLSALEGMRLGQVLLPPRVDKGMSVLRRMKSLAAINYLGPADFWKKFDAGEFPQYKP